MDPESYARTCEALERADTRSYIRGLTKPTLIACGSADGVAFVSAASWFSEHLSDSSLLWLVGAKHAAVLERRRDFSAAMSHFLAAG
jgi:pimeloyl-ACP methyl ester carboxylesterase